MSTTERDDKLFAGPRVRRARLERGLTQAAMAGELGISPSYLNLIERNQRPLTARVLVRLASVHGLDLTDLDRDRGDGAAGLREAFSDPLLSGEVSGPRELADVAEIAPDTARGVAKLYRAYRETLDRLSELSGVLSEAGVASSALGARSAVERFRAAVEPVPYHYGAIDEAAERLEQTLPRRGGREAAIAEWLEATNRLAVRPLPAASIPYLSAYNDRHTGRFYVSEGLSPSSRLVAVAGEAMRLAEPDAIARTVRDLAGEGDEEVRRLVHAHVVAYAGQALAMPYRRFGEEAARMRYDAGALAAHFGVGFGHACRRLVSLRRINASGPPFHAMLVDEAGHVLERMGANGFPAQGFGGQCPKLPVYALAGRPLESRVRTVEMPDGARFVTVSHGLYSQPHGHARPMPRRAVLLGMSEKDAGRTVYAQTAASRDPIAVGLACRLCERHACPVRAEPTLTRPAGLDDWKVGVTMWDFQ